MRESKVEKLLGEFCKAKGITFQKQNGPGERGKADRLLMRNGVAAFLEIKRFGEVPTPSQLRYLAGRVNDGFAAGWCDNVEDGKKFIIKTFKS